MSTEHCCKAFVGYHVVSNSNSFLGLDLALPLFLLPLPFFGITQLREQASGKVNKFEVVFQCIHRPQVLQTLSPVTIHSSVLIRTRARLVQTTVCPSSFLCSSPELLANTDVFFERSTADFSSDSVARSTAAKLKLESYYKMAVDSAIERNAR